LCSASTTSTSRATRTAGAPPLHCSARKDTDFGLTLLFTSCSDSEFTCTDGLCVPMEARCNQIIDCPHDSSDEEECIMVKFGSTYKTEFAPVEVAADGSILRTKVNVTVALQEVLKIGELDSVFSCKIDLRLSWVDQVPPAPGSHFSQRLQFNNLKQEADLNTLSAAERDKVTQQPDTLHHVPHRFGLRKWCS
jgi:hypothetical protein